MKDKKYLATLDGIIENLESQIKVHEENLKKIDRRKKLMVVLMFLAFPITPTIIFIVLAIFNR